MPREARKISESGIYHIYASGNLTKPMTLDNADKKELFALLKDAKSKYDFEIYAFVITKNEFHMCVKESLPLDISNIMKYIFTKYTAYYNKKYDLEGGILRDRFKSTPISGGEEVKTLVRYLHQLPVKLLENPNVFTYPFSSYTFYFNEQTTVNTSYVLSMFAVNLQEARAKFKIYHAMVEFSEFKGEERQSLTKEEVDSVIEKETNLTMEEILALPRKKKYEVAKTLKKRTKLSLRQLEGSLKISRATISKL